MLFYFTLITVISLRTSIFIAFYDEDTEKLIEVRIVPFDEVHSLEVVVVESLICPEIIPLSFLTSQIGILVHVSHDVLLLARKDVAYPEGTFETYKQAGLVALSIKFNTSLQQCGNTYKGIHY